MSDEELCGWLRSMLPRSGFAPTENWAPHKAADLIEQQAARIAKLEAALREVYETWAGSEGFIPETAPEGYLLQLTKKMALIAGAALEQEQ